MHATKRRCLEEHKIEAEPLSQSGRDYGRLFSYSITTLYCPVCNKVRVVKRLGFRPPRLFGRKDIPF